MFTLLEHKRDFYAGGLMTLIGLGTVLEGSTYRLGNLTHMGPGYFPVILGVALILIGVMIAGSALGSREDQEWPEILKKPEWRGWLGVVSGPVMFIIFGEYGGLAPATFACVFVSSFGDRTSTLKGSLILAAVVTAFGVVLFSYVLKIPFPIVRGVWL